MCKYCEFRKWDFDNDDENAEVVAEGEYGTIYIGHASKYDADKKVIRIFTSDDAGTFGFLPKYCPFCGERINI